MPFPPRPQLWLYEAVQYVADRCKEPRPEAEAELKSWLLAGFPGLYTRDSPYGDRRIRLHDGDLIVWRSSEIRSSTERNRVYLWRAELDQRLDDDTAATANHPGLKGGEPSAPASAAAAPDHPLNGPATRSGAATAVYSTGLSGRPTSWSLIEAECRRRYEAGERYPTITEWARILRAWLCWRSTPTQCNQQRRR
jgi:hypothetical protein